MTLYRLLEDAVICELEGDENTPIPQLMYLEKELFDLLRSELVIKDTQKKIPPEWKTLSLTFAGKTIVFRSEDWVNDTIH